MFHMPNEVFDAVRTVLAVREYSDREIAAEVIRRIAEAGHLTASASNQQPWHFIVVRERDGLQKLGSLVRTGPYIRNAQAAVIVAYEKSKGAIGISDASRAVQSMILTAWDEGVGSNWTGFSDLDHVRAEFGLPDTYAVVAVMPLGYPKRKVIGKKKRKPFDEVVSGERFGDPLVLAPAGPALLALDAVAEATVAEARPRVGAEPVGDQAERQQHEEREHLSPSIGRPAENGG